jgi:hypothetical protein
VRHGAIPRRAYRIADRPAYPIRRAYFARAGRCSARFIQWDRYPERAWDDEYTIRDNVGAGKGPEQWLEGTFLRQSFLLLADGKTPPPAKQCPEITEQDLADVLAMARADQSPAKPDEGKISLSDLRQRSQEQEMRGEDRRSRSRDIER